MLQGDFATYYLVPLFIFLEGGGNFLETQNDLKNLQNKNQKT